MKLWAMAALLLAAPAFAEQRPVLVPSLQGKSIAEALAILEREDLRATQIRIENPAPAGNVVSQTPEPNTRVPPGFTVQLTVSTGIPKIPVRQTIPDLFGLTPAQATAGLSALKLRLLSNGSTPSPQPQGTIVAQTPAAHSEIPDNRTVYVTLAAAMPTTRVVPRVIGDPLATAARILFSAGLTTGKPLLRADPGPPGIVLDQYPPPGQPATPGAAVTLTLSQTQPTPVVATPATVPDLRGQTTESAAQTLSRSQLVLGSITPALDPEPQGQIFNQTPPPGARVKPGSPVNVAVSSGGVYVPDVTQLDQSVASKKLSQAGLSTGTVSTALSAQPAGRVQSQRPAPGTLVRPGAAIALVISQPAPAPTTVTVPNVTQMPDQQAQDAISTTGLAPGPVRPQPSSQPEGTVVAQDPPAGSQALPGTPVQRFISQPAAPVPPAVVPNLAGLTLSQARDILNTANLDLGELTGALSEDSQVASQSPAPYSQVQPHTRVAVTLASNHRTLWEIAGAGILVFAGAFAFFRKPPRPPHNFQELRVIPNRNPDSLRVSLKIGEAPDLALHLKPHPDPGSQTIRETRT